MKIFVDADACPVVRIVERLAKKHNIPVTLLCDTNHVLNSDYSEVKVIGAGMDAVDFALISLCKKGDIVVTQDYGVAAMALGKGAYAIHQSGKWYTNDNIDGMLMERHVAKKARRSSSKNHMKGPHKRTSEDDEHFMISFEKMILFYEMDVGKECEFEVDCEPGFVKNLNGIIRKVISAKSRIVVKDSKAGEEKSFAPSVYQSCMEPDNVVIHTLQINDQGNGIFEIKTKYDSCRINILECDLTVFPWHASLQRMDCRHCENCGRCS